MLAAVLVAWLVAGPRAAVAGQAPARAPVVALLETAGVLPAEFRADVLIRLAESGALGTPSAAGDALADAFTAAAGAEEPFRLDWGAPISGLRISAQQAARVRAFARQIDQLSLETKALRALAGIDPARAWSLEPFVALRLPPLRCDDVLAHNVEDAYRNLAAFAARLPDAQRFLALQRYVAAMFSALQIGPTAALIAGVPMPNDERTLLIADFAFELERVADGDRAFTTAIARDHLPERIQELGALSLWQGDDPAALVDAFRTFLVSHFNGRRCAGEYDGPDLRVVQWFNDDLRKLTSADIAPIDYDAFTAHSVEPWSRSEDPESAPAYAQLNREIHETLGPVPPPRLGPRPPGAWLAAQYVRNPEAVVGDVLVWHGTGSRSAGEYVFQKASLLQLLVDRLPTGEGLYELAADELAGFLAAVGPLTDDRLVWFLHVTTLFDSASRGVPSERERMLERFEGSGNLVMTAYASLERLTGAVR